MAPIVTLEAKDLSAASALEESHRLSFWDSLIVTAAHKGGATHLLSEDLNPGQRIKGLQIENPLAAAR